MLDQESNKKMDNFYSILECTSNATTEEIKKNYQRLVRECHPDKGAQSPDKFLLIDKAYKILKDDQTRKNYDSSLLANSCNEHTLIYAELHKEDIHLDCQGTAFYPCRCGEQFVIEQEHLDEPECVIECGECSNSISIT